MVCKFVYHLKTQITSWSTSSSSILPPQILHQSLPFQPLGVAKIAFLFDSVSVVVFGTPLSGFGGGRRWDGSPWRPGGGGLCGGAADWVGLLLRRVARPAPGARHRGGDQGDRHGEAQPEAPGEPAVRDRHSAED